MAERDTNDVGFSWTLATALGEMLLLAEEKFGHVILPGQCSVLTSYTNHTLRFGILAPVSILSFS